MSDTLTPDEASHIYLIECHAHSEEMWTDGMPVSEVRAFCARHADCQLEVHFSDDMGLIPNEAS